MTHHPKDPFHSLRRHLAKSRRVSARYVTRLLGSRALSVTKLRRIPRLFLIVVTRCSCPYCPNSPWRGGQIDSRLSDCVPKQSNLSRKPENGAQQLLLPGMNSVYDARVFPRSLPPITPAGNTSMLAEEIKRGESSRRASGTGVRGVTSSELTFSHLHEKVKLIPPDLPSAADLYVPSLPGVPDMATHPT